MTVAPCACSSPTWSRSAARSCWSSSTATSTAPWARPKPAAGPAPTVACLVGLSFTRLGTMGGAGDVEGERQGGGSHGEMPVFGMTAPGAGAAMAMRIYFDRYGGGPEQLAAIPIAFRKHARLN